LQETEHAGIESHFGPDRDTQKVAKEVRSGLVRKSGRLAILSEFNATPLQLSYGLGETIRLACCDEIDIDHDA
jgi:hypothetical protein